MQDTTTYDISIGWIEVTKRVDIQRREKDFPFEVTVRYARENRLYHYYTTISAEMWKKREIEAAIARCVVDLYKCRSLLSLSLSHSLSLFLGEWRLCLSAFWLARLQMEFFGIGILICDGLLMRRPSKWNFHLCCIPYIIIIIIIIIIAEELAWSDF